MPDINELIVSLEQSLKQSKKDLDEALQRKSEFQNQPNQPPEQLSQIEMEISALTNMVRQTEEAIENVSKLKESGETGDFYIAAERQNGET